MHGIWLHEASCYYFRQSKLRSCRDGRADAQHVQSQPRLYSWGVLHRCQTGGARKSQLVMHGRSHNKRLESEANGKRRIEGHFFHCRDRRHLRNFSRRSQYLFLPFHHSTLFECGVRLLRANKSKTKERNQIHSASLSTLEAGEGPFPPRPAGVMT